MFPLCWQPVYTEVQCILEGMCVTVDFWYSAHYIVGSLLILGQIKAPYLLGETLPDPLSALWYTDDIGNWYCSTSPWLLYYSLWWPPYGSQFCWHKPLPSVNFGLYGGLCRWSTFLQAQMKPSLPVNFVWHFIVVQAISDHDQNLPWRDNSATPCEVQDWRQLWACNGHAVLLHAEVADEMYGCLPREWISSRC